MATLCRIAPEIPVSDLGAAIGFYLEKLGFALVMEIPKADYAIVERDGIAIHLFEDAGGSHTPVGLHIFTHELDELRAELRERGARLSEEIVRRPWGNRDFRIRDLFGNEIKFTEPVGD